MLQARKIMMRSSEPFARRPRREKVKDIRRLKQRQKPPGMPTTIDPGAFPSYHTPESRKDRFLVKGPMRNF